MAHGRHGATSIGLVCAASLFVGSLCFPAITTVSEHEICTTQSALALIFGWGFMLLGLSQGDTAHLSRLANIFIIHGLVRLALVKSPSRTLSIFAVALTMLPMLAHSTSNTLKGPEGVIDSLHTGWLYGC